ncbi:MAG: hypothetical protein CME65_01725 [Halobacteriovoraceae bacterium]|nr:hypothetical protein [Halobacteriovoraceae bacterium]|tara:strand:- start:255 stop:1424 length:1170 start_codon:yes stop_codon:yes gene_type:complete
MAIQVFNILDFVVVIPLGPILMRELDITTTQFGFLAASYKVSSGVISLFYSFVGDHFNRKKFTIVALVMFILATLFCAIAPNYTVLLTARIMAGFFGGILTPSVYAIITDLIPFERRGRALGMIMASFSVSSTLGIPLGLMIADSFGWRSTFHFIGAGATVVLILNLIFLPSVPVPEISKFNYKEQILRLWKTFIDLKHREAFLVIMFYTGSGFMLFPFLSPYAVNNIGLAETDLKYIYLVGGVFTIFMSRTVGHLTDTLGPLKVFFPAVIMSLPFIYLYTTAEFLSLSHLLIISTGFMVMLNARFVPLMTMISKVPDENKRGSFMGVLMSLRSFTAAFATAFTGFLISEDAAGKLINFDLSGFVSIGLSVFAIFFVLRLHRQVFTPMT